MPTSKEIESIMIKVGNSLGKGFTENIYHEAICSLMRHAMIGYSKEASIPVTIDNIEVGCVKADIVVQELELVIECKSIENFHPKHISQLVTYMKLLNYKNGIMVNFNSDAKKHVFVEIVRVLKRGENYEAINIDTSEIIHFDELKMIINEL